MHDCQLYSFNSEFCENGREPPRYMKGGEILNGYVTVSFIGLYSGWPNL
jgi:hypothetical protein